jgi:ABC-2 type transport system permease protein
MRRGSEGPLGGGTAAAAALFARLKWRMLRNGLRGQAWRVGLFVLGCLFGLWFAVMGFLLFALPGLDSTGPDRDDVAVIVLALGGGVLVLGWVLLPLVFFGVDETLDPARFALLPLTRRTLLTGMLAASLVGVAAMASAIATAGSVLTAGVYGGPAAAAVQAVGVVAGLFLCLIASRALTTAFAGMLRSRRMRDLAAILMALLAALLGPLQLAVLAVFENPDLDRIAAAARVVAWTPFGAPYTVGLDVAEGRSLAAVAKLAGIGLILVGLLRWWSRSLESAMADVSVAGGPGVRARSAGGPVAQLFPWAVRWAPRNAFGALVAREFRYWWRDARRRAGVITIAVVGVFVPVMLNLGGPMLEGEAPSRSPFMASASMLMVGTLATLGLANQFGYDGSAYAAHVVVGIRGRTELQTRVVAYSLFTVPLLVAIAVLLALLLGRPALLPAMLGGLAAAYGTGVAVNLLMSVLGAYALPDTSNPFSVNTGAGVAKSLLSLVALIGSVAAAAPFLAVSALSGDVWRLLAVPLGLAYGVGAAALGCYNAGDVLDRRAPELLQAVTPRH